ncbi:Cthe_2314 family HEPN domain-containing protein [Lewinella sp. IMCC34183]|uniref:Cthe_2314 family HEPN domain-containing protein n=1 Tax=Lewinella sp. IMCC34183 TaxID=2248762 RepID=UPI0013006937|nr:Cthe_2314 family HEPN domain-containing protein [Lewinella sp. IMCC34183]
MDQFKDTSLFSTLTPVLRDYIIRSNYSMNRDLMNIHEEYCADTFTYATNITDCIDQTYHAIEMLSGYRRNIHKSINRPDYVTFMIENFYMRFTSIYDRMLRLLNQVFELGLPERECRDNTIVKNGNIRTKSFVSALNKANKLISTHRANRNKIAHSQTHTEDELNSLKPFYHLRDNDVSFDHKKYAHLYKTMTDDFVKQKKEKFTELLDTLVLYVKEFFDNVGKYVLEIASKKK